MYSLLSLPTSITILLLLTCHGVYVNTMNMGYKSWYKNIWINGEYNRHTGNTTENSGVAAEAAELRGWVVLVAFHSSF